MPVSVKSIIRSIEAELGDIDATMKILTEQRESLVAALKAIRKQVDAQDSNDEGLSKFEAAVRFLEDRGSQAGLMTIVNGLLEGGLEIKSNKENFYNALHQSLVEHESRGDAVKRIDRKWSLLKWNQEKETT